MKQNQDDIMIKCKCRLSKQMFPKNKIVGNGDFGIISVTVLDTLQGEPQINKWGTITLTGCMCEINDDEIYVIIGKEIENEKYGIQYQIVFMCIDVKLTNREDQFIFLEKVLPEKQCVELFKAFENPIEVLENKDIQALTSVKGIGVPTALKLIERYENSKDYSEAYVKLDRFGLTKNKIDKLVDYYGSPHIVISKIEENPYILIDEVDGIGWDTADDMALQGGLGEYSLIRTKAYVKYYLYEEANMGNTWVDIDNLLNAVDGAIGYDLPQETLSQALREMNESKIIWTNEDRDKVGLLRYYNLENNVAKELIRLNEAENCFKFEGWQDKIKKLEERQKWEFTEEQIEGIQAILENQVVMIIGGAGNGKSSTVAGMLEVFKSNYSFAQTALSGRASCNLSEITGEDGYTIHRLLGYNPESGFVYNKDNPLHIDICILDEISMVGADIYYKLIQALKTGSKLVMLGDKHQLEAIGIGNIMFDMIESDCIKVVELTKIHRQAEKSAIITNSIKIKDKEHIVDKNFTGTEIRGELQDLELDIYKNKDTTHRRIVEHFKELLPQTENIFDIQVIVPMKERGKASAYYLNNLLQEIVINTNTNQYISVGENSKYPFKIYIGDKVLNNKNNYKTLDDNANETPIFNGDLGIVVDMDIYRRTLIVDFNNKGIIYIPKSHLNKITLGYAMTCHKCIPKDTYILTSNGLDTMEDYIDIEKIGTYNYTHKNNIYNGLKMEKPSLIHNVGMSECKEIITNNGYSLVATLDHGIDVISEDGYIIRKDIQDLTTKDQVVIAQNTNIFGDIVKIPDTYFKYDLDIRSVRYNKPKILDEKLSMLLGMIVADGTIRHAHICYGKTNREVVEVFASLTKNIFNYEINIRYDNTGNIYLAEINSTDIVAFLMNFGGLEPNNKAIPKLIKQTSKNNICSFLKGMFEDGGVHLKKGIFDMIELTQSNNKKPINEIQLLLLNLGILSSIKEYKKYGKSSYLNTPTNKLFIYRKDAIKFNELIGFIAYHKQEALQLAYINTKPSERNSIKNISKVILKIMNNHKLSLDKKFKMRLNSSINRNGITKYVLNTFLSYCENIYNDKNIEYLKYLNDNCLIQNISQINDKGEIECYCFTMPESGKFIQNGFRGFNCQGSGIKYVIAGLDYSHYKLLTKEMVYTMLTRAKDRKSVV